MDNKFEILTFKDGDFSLPVNVSPTERTLWLTSTEMALLFDTTPRNIRMHISNIFKEDELDLSVGKKSFLTAADGKNYETMIYRWGLRKRN